MFGRITLFEIDTMRIDLDTALERFKEAVLPALRKQPGYKGVYVMRTPEGKGMLMTLWETQEAAQAGVVSGFWAEQIDKFVSVFRAPPGREHYEVVFIEDLAATAA